MRKILFILSVILGGLVFLVDEAYAHTPSVSDSCSGLVVSLTNYETAPGADLNNRVTVTIDGTAVSFDFDGSYANSFPWEQTSNHVWSVVIDANRVNGPPATYDWSATGDETACQTTTTSSTTTTSTTTTTTEPEEPTTTTTAATTTTLADIVTTTTGVTTTTSATDPTTTTTTVVPTNTSPPASSSPPTTPPPRLPRELPNTGSEEASDTAWSALVAVCFGAFLVMAARRRTV